MFKLLKNSIRRVTPVLIWNFLTEIKIAYFISSKYGHFNTVRSLTPVDENNSPLPWYTYPAIEYLSHLDLKSKSIFEYGSGNSTFWWSLNSAKVISVESDRSWFNMLQSKLSSLENVTSLFSDDPTAYSQNPLALKSNIIIIDGLFRTECVDFLLSSDIPNNLEFIIFDNSDWYPNTVQKLRERLSWVQVDFHGFGPINSYSWTTSIFINPTSFNSIKYKHNLKSTCSTPLECAPSHY